MFDGHIDLYTNVLKSELVIDPIKIFSHLSNHMTIDLVNIKIN